MKKNWIKYAGSLVWVGAWMVLSMRFTSIPGVAAAIAAALCGLFAPDFLARWRVRETAMASAAVLLGLMNWGFTDVLRRSPFFFSILGAEYAYSFLEVLMWGGTAVAVTVLLEVLRRRFPALIVLQVLFAGATLAAILAAHRDGAQHRPFFLVDPMLLRGEDPLLALWLVGVIIAVSVLIWLFCQTSGTKRARDPIVLLVLLAVALLALPASATKYVLRVAGGGGSSGSKNSEGSGKNQDPNPNNTSPKGQPKPVAIVIFHDDYNPPGSDYYFRQTAFSTYRNNRLIVDPSKHYDADTVESFPTAESRVHDVPPADGSQLVHTTIALLVPHSRPFGLVAPLTFGPADNPDPQRFDRAYNVDSLGPARPLTELIKLPVGTPPGGETALHYYVTAPDDPRFAQIVAEAVASIDEQYRNQPVYRAVAVKLWMDEHVTYNLQAKHDTAADPVADFLFGDRNGYCVHFAQAAALLYRTAGVPARVAQGYAVQSRQRGHGSSLMIRDSDAHAWPEIYIAGAGWVVLDINAKKTVSPEPPPPDLDQQRTLGQMARHPSPDNKNDPKPGDKPGDKPGAGSGSGFRARAWETIACALLLAILVLYAAKFWRRIAVHFCRPANLSRVVFRAALDRLADAGVLRPMAQTREQFSLGIASTAPSLRPLTELHIASSFGRHAESRPRSQYLDLLRNISRELRRSRPAWRIAIGYLDPLSWTRVK